MRISLLVIILSTTSLSSHYQACFSPSGSPGECIKITKCTSVMRLLMERPPMAIYDKLKKSICGFEGEIAKICCDISSSPHRESENTGNHSHSTTVEPKKPQNVYLHPKFRLLEPELCGRIMPEPKIFGGSDTKLFEYPWMAQLGYIRSNQSKDHHIKEFLCAGTIINKKYVLTAAHCIHHLRDNLEFVTVRVGEHDLTKERDCESYDNGSWELCAEKYQDFDFENVFVHPRYSYISLQNDIGLIRINGTMNFEGINKKPASVSPICLSLKPWGDADRYGELGQVVGWGWTEKGTPYRGKLRKVEIPVLPVDDCIKTFRDNVFIKIGHKQICAGGVRGRDSCIGDSGGPLQAVSRHMGESKIVQFGIVSFGKKYCAQKDFPGIYTSVAHYLDWILDTIQE